MLVPARHVPRPHLRHPVDRARQPGVLSRSRTQNVHGSLPNSPISSIASATACKSARSTARFPLIKGYKRASHAATSSSVGSSPVRARLRSSGPLAADEASDKLRFRARSRVLASLSDALGLSSSVSLSDALELSRSVLFSAAYITPCVSALSVSEYDAISLLAPCPYPPYLRRTPPL